MISPTFINLLDFFLLAAILLFAFEALRVTHFKAEPLCAMAFALITIGAFGWAINDLYGINVPPYAVLLHAGFAVHVLLLYRKQRRLTARVPQRRRTDPEVMARLRRANQLAEDGYVRPTVPQPSNPPPKQP